MKNTGITLLLILICSSTIYAQALLDAQRLQKATQSEDYQTQLEILSKYYRLDIPDKEISASDVLEAYYDETYTNKQNPFLREPLQKIIKVRNYAKKVLSKFESATNTIQTKINQSEEEMDKLERQIKRDKEQITIIEERYDAYKQPAEDMFEDSDIPKSKFVNDLDSLLRQNKILPITDTSSKSKEEIIKEFRDSLDAKKDDELMNLRKTIKQNQKLFDETEEQKIQYEQEKKAILKEKIYAENIMSRENISAENQEVLISVLSTIKPQVEKTTLSSNATVLEQGKSSFQSGALNAVAGFVAERMKDELNIAFFRKFKVILNNYRLEVIFPTVTQLISDTDAFNYGITVQILKNAFQRDLQQLIFHVPQFVQELKLDISDDKVELAGLLIDLVQEVRKGIHPADILNHINQTIQEKNLNLDSRIVKLFQSAEIISSSLKNTSDYDNIDIHNQENSTTWIPIETFRKLINQPKVRNYYMGFLYQQLKEVWEEEALQGSNADINQNILALVIPVYQIVQNIDNQLDVLNQQKKAGEKIEAQSYIEIYQSIFELVDFPLRSEQLSENIGLNISLDPYRRLQNTVLDTYFASNNKDYGAMLSNLIVLMGDIGIFSAQNRTIKERFIKYGAFAVAIAQAQSANDMKSAIQSVALPTGSSSVKRKSFVNVSFNAFGGLGNGVEFVHNPRRNLFEKPEYNIGFAAPIGIAFSWGWRKLLFKDRNNVDITKKSYKKFGKNYQYYKKEKLKALRGSSGSIFISFLDLGAVVSYRFNDPNPLPRELTVQQLLAPGLFYTHGVKNSPISWFIGAQLSPQLRTLPPRPMMMVDEEEKANAIRFNIGITVDIPLFNFYTKTEKEN